MKPIHIDIKIWRYVLHLFLVTDISLTYSKICVADVRREVARMQQGDGNIARVKAVRKLTGWDLRMSKLWVDLNYPVVKE